MKERKFSLRYFATNIRTELLLSSIFVSYSFWMILEFRPVQDDYVTLDQLASGGFWGPTKDVWDSLGGNISTVLLRSILLWDSRYAPNFYGLRLFPVLTVIVIFVGIHFFCVLCGSALSAKQSIVATVVLAVGMEGLFTPGIIGILNFSAASLVHFWPICLLPTIIWLIAQKPRLKMTLGYLLLIFAANTNITESLLYLSVFLFVCIQRDFPRSRSLFAVFFSLLSLVTIIVAPGFTKRSAIFSLDRDYWAMPLNFFRNSAIFTTDILTHPMIIFLFISGAALPTFQKLILRKNVLQRILLLEVTYLLLSIAGSTFAYPAWHQSLGLIPLAGYLSYQLGIRLRNFFPKFSRRSFLIAILVLMLPVMSRLSWQLDRRAEIWDANLQSTNFRFSEYETQRAEIIYPPFGLGVEDIFTWEWMADPFYSWKSQFK
jgi:hypothetical protein